MSSKWECPESDKSDRIISFRHLEITSFIHPIITLFRHSIIIAIPTLSISVEWWWGYWWSRVMVIEFLLMKIREAMRQNTWQIGRWQRDWSENNRLNVTTAIILVFHLITHWWQRHLSRSHSSDHLRRLDGYNSCSLQSIMSIMSAKDDNVTEASNAI